MRDTVEQVYVISRPSDRGCVVTFRVGPMRRLVAIDMEITEAALLWYQISKTLTEQKIDVETYPIRSEAAQRVKRVEESPDAPAPVVTEQAPAFKEPPK